jgi:surface protein
MVGVFSGCKSLTSLDISSWSTGKVEYMNSMFYCCEKLTELNISNWNYINTKSNGMNNMFYCCLALELSNIKMDNCSQDIKSKIAEAHRRRNSQII